MQGEISSDWGAHMAEAEPPCCLVHFVGGAVSGSLPRTTFAGPMLVEMSEYGWNHTASTIPSTQQRGPSSSLSFSCL